MQPAQQGEVRASRSGGHALRIRHRADRQHLPRDRRGNLGRDDPDRLGRGDALLRHRADVRPRPVRAARRPFAALEEPRRLRAVVQGRPHPQARPQAGYRLCALDQCRRRFEPAFRLQLRRHDAVVRGQPAAAQPRTDGHLLHPRHRPLHPRRRPARGLRAGDGRRLAGLERTARPGRGQGDRRRGQRMGGLPGGAGAAGLRLLPAGRALHAAGAGRAGQLPAALRGARRGGGGGRRLQLRHPRHRRQGGREIQLRPRAGRDPRQGPQDRGGLRRIRRAAAGGGAAIRRCPSGGARPSWPAPAPLRSCGRTSTGSAPRSPACSGPISRPRACCAKTPPFRSDRSGRAGAGRRGPASPQPWPRPWRHHRSMSQTKTPSVPPSSRATISPPISRWTGSAR